MLCVEPEKGNGKNAQHTPRRARQWEKRPAYPKASKAVRKTPSIPKASKAVGKTPGIPKASKG